MLEDKSAFVQLLMQPGTKAHAEGFRDPAPFTHPGKLNGEVYVDSFISEESQRDS